MIGNGVIKDRALAMTGASKTIIAYLTRLGVTSVAELTFAQKLKLTTMALWEQAAAWAATPLGMATIAAVSIFALVKIIDGLTTSLEESREALASLKEEYTENESELTTLNDELQTTIDRINEIQGKDSLTFTEVEELENLRRQNSELERQIALLETIQKQKTQELNKSFIETMDKDLGDKNEIDAHLNKFVSKNYVVPESEIGTDYYSHNQGYQVTIISEKALLNSAIMRRSEIYDELQSASDADRKRLQEDLDEIEEYLISKSQEFLDTSKGISYVSNPTTDDEKKVNEWLDFINDFNDKLMISMGRSGAKENAVNRLIFGEFSEVTKDLKELGEQGSVTAEHLTDPKYDAFIDKCIDLGIISDDSTDSLSFLALAFNAVADAASGASSDTQSTAKQLQTKIDAINEGIDNVQSRLSNLSNALTKLHDGSLEANDVIDLLQQFPELAPYVDLTAASFGNLEIGLKKLIQSSPDGLIQTLQEFKHTADITESQKLQIDNLCEALRRLPLESVTTSTRKMTDAFKQFMHVLSGTNDMDAGFSQLSTIFNDIKDGEGFDWGSILSDNFEEEFGGLGDSYEEFMRVVANSPQDIDACRSAFNELATAYIFNSGALDKVTDSNRDVAAAMLEQMGVANAVAIVDWQLALNKERLKYASSEYTEASYAEIQALYDQAIAGSVAKQALAELAVQKYLSERKVFSTERDIEQLLNLATAANITKESLSRINEARGLVEQANYWLGQYNQALLDPSRANLASIYLQSYGDLLSEANAILSEPIEYETIRPTDLIVDFEGVSKSAGSAKDDVESLYNSVKNGIEELIEYRKSMLEKDIENQKDALQEQIDALQDFYDEQREMLEEQYDEEQYLAEQSEKRKAITDLKGELAMLANDDSAWAQRRKLELQEELSDAEKERSEFEGEHALDVTLDMLDYQQAAQEKQIQAQIDALDKKLNDPHALYNQALADIKNNTLDLYQEMIEFNRKWGSGNDDDIRDMWNDAYESNEDYRDKTGSTYKDIELGDYTGYNASGVGKVSAVSSTLRKGSKGDGVKAIQHALNQLGYGNSGTRSLDGSFGSGTRSAVIAFQRANGLSGDGVVDSATRAKFRALGYATGTDNATPGWHELFEGDLDEYIFTSGDGSRYRMFSGLGDKVLNAGATDFLYQFANSGGSILTKMISDLLKYSGFGNISKPIQAIEVNAGNVIVEGNASTQTVSAIRRAQRDNLEFVLKELNKLNK